jgi:hypothetical protein
MTITATIDLVDESGRATQYEDARMGGIALSQCIGERITSAVGETDGTLTLTLLSQTKLIVHDTWPDYESYTIRHRDQIIVV